MKLKEVFKLLSYGELRNLAMSMDGSGEIEERHQNAVMHFINEGLLKLHSRFDMNTKDVLIQTHKHITFYHLRTRFAESQSDMSSESYLYIKDLDKDPFEDDVIKIMSVYDTHGAKLPLNNSTNPSSLFTPQPLILQVPHPKDGEYLNVLYKAKHVPLTEEGGLEQNIDLPDVLHMALRAYVAAKVFGTMGSPENAATASIHATAYETACLEADQMDLVNTSVVATNIRFTLNGWI